MSGTGLIWDRLQYVERYSSVVVTNMLTFICYMRSFRVFHLIMREVNSIVLKAIFNVTFSIEYQK